MGSQSFESYRQQEGAFSANLQECDSVLQYNLRLHDQGRAISRWFDVPAPRSLIFEAVPDNEAQRQFRALFVAHWPSLLEAEGPFHCVACGKPAKAYTDYNLRLPGGIIDTVSAICCRGACESKAQLLRMKAVDNHIRTVQHSSGSDARAPEAQFRWSSACIVCDRTDGTKQCGRCKLTSYCSRNCQKADWPRHKAVCTLRSSTSKNK